MAQPTPTPARTGDALGATIDFPGSPASAWRSRTAWLVLGAVTLVGTLVDLWSKAYAFSHVADQPVTFSRSEVLTSSYLGNLIPPHSPVVVIHKVLEFTLVLNPGAVFGMGAGKRWFFIIFTAGALLFGLWMFARMTRAREWMAHAAIGLLLAGGFGNLYDRLAFACVRDFIHPLPGVVWPWSSSGGGGTEIWPYVSNIADLWLIIGIGILVIRSLRARPATPANAAVPAQ